MKIQYTAVIFILIAIPILLVVSYYMGLQIDTITLQTTYNTKLLASTKEGIEAFEINTVEWNSKYSDVANSRRRNVEAAINTFTQSLANNLGISGANKEYLEAYLPAVLYTLYDGYYIYTPIKTKETLKNEEGQDALTKDGEIIYKAKENGVQEEDSEGEKYSNATTNPTDAFETTEHTLLPFISYSEQIGDITVNYTLDNYIKVYGNFACKDDYKNYGGDKTKPINERGSEAYVQEEGHLVYFDESTSSIKDTKLHDGTNYKLKYNGIVIKPEILTENVVYKYKNKDLNDKDSDGDIKEFIYEEKNFKYIYIEDSQGDKTKLYYEESNNYDDQVNPTLSDEEKEKQKPKNQWFTMNSKDERVFLSDNVTNVTQYVYKKVSLPSQEIGDNRYINFYQVLNGVDYDDVGNIIGGEKGNWYADWNDDGELTPSEKIDDTLKEKYGLAAISLYKDCSAIKYYVQSYYFTRWINNCVSDQLSGNDEMGFTYSDIFTVDETNDPGNPDIAENSIFYQHKNQIIQKLIINSLAQAIHTYEGSDGKLPNLMAEEWEQVLSNVSMVSFLQGIPIGLKTYNSYAIATSTNNREYVDPNEIYFVNNDDEYYHRCYCDLTGDLETLKGYRSIDFIEKNYIIKDDDDNEKNNYYFLHNGNGTNKLNSSMSCYYCLVNRANYTETFSDEYQTAYETALARERYKANQDVILAKDFAEFTVVKDMIAISDDHGTVGDGKAEIGDTITWRITIENIGLAPGTAYIDDYSLFPKGLIIEEDGGLNIRGGYGAEGYGLHGTINLNAGETKTIDIKTTVTDDVKLGNIVNTVIITESETDKIAIAQDYADTNIEKSVPLVQESSSKYYDIVLVLDHSISMKKEDIRALKAIVKDTFMETIADSFPESSSDGQGSRLAIIKFGNKAEYLGTNGFKETFKQGDIDSFIVKDKESFEKIKKRVDDISDIIGKAGTNYLTALEKTKNMMIKMDEGDLNKNENILIFMSDGYPTSEGSLTEENRYYDGKYYQRTAVLGLVVTKWVEDKDAKKQWNSIVEQAEAIEATKKYGIAFNETDAVQGLGLFCDQTFEATDTDSLKEIFNDLANSLKPVENGPQTKVSINGKIEIDIIKLKRIEISTNTGIDKFTAEEAQEKGYIVKEGEKYQLDLNSIGSEKNVTIVY